MPLLQSAYVSLASSSDSENQDSVVADHELGLFAVCDGMGGTRGGKAASQTAAVAVTEYVRKFRPQLASVKGEQKIAKLNEIVRGAAQYACDTVLKLAQEKPELSSMGTTLTMVLVHGKDACLAHIGDSRLYLHRRGKVHQLSKDHSLIGELVRGGEISPIDAISHPLSNVLTRSIGKGDGVLADCLHFEVIPDDTLLLCTDGLWASFADCNSFLPHLDGNTPTETSQNIARHCVGHRRKIDDVTIVVVEVSSSDSDVIKRDQALSEFVHLKIDTLQQVYLFSDLQMSEVYKLLGISELLEITPGELIIEQGENSAALYIILEGEVQILRNNSELARFKKGQHFGEMAFFSNESRSASAKATMNTQLIKIEQEAFSSLINKESRIAISSLWKLATELSSRLKASNEHLDFSVRNK